MYEINIIEKKSANTIVLRKNIGTNDTAKAKLNKTKDVLKRNRNLLSLFKFILQFFNFVKDKTIIM
jgi:hypothetical protein